MSLAILYRETGTLNLGAIRYRTWRQQPRDFKTGQPRGILWLWLIPVILLAAAFEFTVSPVLTKLWTSLLPFFAETPGRSLKSLMDVPEQWFGAWYLLILWAFQFVGNYLLGEEFFWRSVMLPKMKGVFGKWDWLANIGRCYQCYMSFLGGLERDPNYRWRFDKNRSNGAISDYGAHMTDLARMLVGDVAKVSANLSCFIDRQGINGHPCESGNDSATVALQFENGVQGMIQISEVVHMGDRVVAQKVILLGDSGTLIVDHSFARVFDPHAIPGSEIRGTRNSENKFETLSVPDEFWGKVNRKDLLAPYFQQSVGARLFIDSILSDKPVTPSFYDGWKVQEVIDAAIESHNNDRWIAIKETS